MVVPKEILTDYKEIYEKAYNLVNEESKNDPTTNPFKSHYEAREILKDAMKKLNSTLETEIESNDDDEDIFTYKIILGFIYRDLGRISVFCEEIPLGEKYFLKCLATIGSDSFKPEAVIPFLGCLNDLGIVWANRSEYTKSKEYLVRAEEVYTEFQLLDVQPLCISDIFGTVEEIEVGKGHLELEKLYTLTMFYMAQVLGHLEQLELSAQYCNVTLRRQLCFDDLDSIDWALNAATLSQYYIGERQFNEARHHLAAATLIMDEFKLKMITTDMSEDAKAAANENFEHRYADIARCWAKYGLALLEASEEHLLSDDDDKLAADTSRITLYNSNYQFNNLKERLKIHEKEITTKLCLTIEDAEVVFKFVILWLNKSKEYYRADTEASQYAKIIQDYADLYKLVAFFEEDPSKQCKLHKKRAVYYEDLLKILNPRHYLSICRECWYGCAVAYSAILENKLDAIDNLKFDEKPTPHALQKINKLCNKAIKNYKAFIDSYKDPQTKQMQTNINTDDRRILLFTNFHLGRLYYKIIAPDKELQLINLKNSLQYYETFLAECAIYEEAASTFKNEISICKEMTALLPHKISKITRELTVKKKLTD